MNSTSDYLGHLRIINLRRVSTTPIEKTFWGAVFIDQDLNPRPLCEMKATLSGLVQIHSKWEAEWHVAYCIAASNKNLQLRFTTRQLVPIFKPSQVHKILQID